MAFFPTTEQVLADDLLDSIEDGGIDLADAVVQALMADGIAHEVASQCRHAMALAYRVRSRR